MTIIQSLSNGTRTAGTNLTRPATNGAYYAASVLYNAGFRGWPLTIMTAISGVESNWFPTKLNNDPSTGDYSVGLTQINYYGNLDASRTQQFGSSQLLLNDPSSQAAATFQLAGGNSLSGLGNWGGGSWNGQAGSAPSFSEPGYATKFVGYLAQAAAAVAQVGTFGPASSSATNQVGSWPGGASLVSTQIGAASAAAAGNTGCGNINGGNGYISFLGLNVLTGCQIKAMLGGAIMIAGGVIALAGVAVIVTSTFGGKAASTVLEIAGVGAVASKLKRPAAPTASEMTPPNTATGRGDPTRRGSASSRTPKVPADEAAFEAA